MELPDEEIRPALQRLKRLAPSAHLVLFTKAKAVGDVRQVMAAGVRSYLPKDASAEQAKMAIRACSTVTVTCRMTRTLMNLVIKAVVLKASFRHVSLKSCSYWRKVYLTRRLLIY